MNEEEAIEHLARTLWLQDLVMWDTPGTTLTPVLAVETILAELEALAELPDGEGWEGFVFVRPRRFEIGLGGIIPDRCRSRLRGWNQRHRCDLAEGHEGQHHNYLTGKRWYSTRK